MGDGSFVTDAVLGSGVFDTGSRGYIKIPSTTLGDACTMAARVKLNNDASNIQTILSSWSPSSGGFSFALNWWNKGNRIVLLETWNPGGQAVQTASVDRVISYERWHHVAVTMDRPTNTASLYVDGQPVRYFSRRFAGDFAGSKPLSIGRYYGTPAFLPFHFTGRIDDVRVYNVLLTAAEIGELKRLTPEDDW
jgi:hypothetical protein